MADWIRVADVDACGPGSLLRVEVEGEDVVLANVDGDFYALKDQCSHQDYPLSDGELEGTKVECIYHGAKFDVCTGKAVQLPAVRPVKSFETEVREDGVFVRAGG